MSRPLFILGFDGLSPRYWEDGFCDLLKDQMKHHGILKSVDPPISPAAWASFLTGVDPSVHGITRWRQEGWHPPYPIFGHSLHLPLWVEYHGKTFALLNVPCLKPRFDGLGAVAPPKEFNVTSFVGGLLWSEREHYAKPQKLLSRLRKDDYRVHCGDWELKPIEWRKSDEGVKWLLDCAGHRRRIGLPQADVVVLVYVFPDVLSHARWRSPDIISDMHHAVSVEIAYWLDEMKIGETHNWAIISDHGFQDMDAPDHLTILKSLGEERVSWMEGGHHMDGVFMSNFLDLNGASIKDVLVRALEV
ncbi:MAG: alkaline phosphatase family protein [Planctomycetota bacterium]|jgi:hypothetical protein